MPKGHEQLNAGTLLAGLLEIVDSGSALSMQFERLAQDVGVGQGAPTIVFLSGIKKILRELPDKTFADKSARLALVDAVQDALDQAIEAEEEMQEQMHDNEQEGKS